MAIRPYKISSSSLDGQIGCAEINTFPIRPYETYHCRIVRAGLKPAPTHQHQSPNKGIYPLVPIYRTPIIADTRSLVPSAVVNTPRSKYVPSDTGRPRLSVKFHVPI